MKFVRLHVVVVALCLSWYGGYFENFVTVLLLALAGASMNLCAMWCNGGKMPVKLKTNGWLDESDLSRSHVSLNNRTRVRWLCDVIYLWPIGIFSVGDVVVGIAIFLLLFR